MKANQPRGGTEDERVLQAPGPRDLEFLSTDPWRVFRIMGEFVAGFDELADLGPAVSIFGSARVKPEEEQYAMAVELGRRLGEQGFAVITGGGPGIMEAANRGAGEAGARSVGLNIELSFEQHANPYLTDAMDFHYFFVRKTMFLKYAVAFVIFPGGFGTLDELFEAVTLIQTGKMQNFPVVLYGRQYWTGLLDWLRDRMKAEGKIRQDELELLTLADSADEAVRLITRGVRGAP
ncbi:MAG: TIGR00730 family Rossman fold protein, partial [Spirochaetales bacterium]|nr:TIGR00730 family Rossman fold protein [Spirochaetales bacterium]